MGVFHIFGIPQIVPDGHSLIVKEEWVVWEVFLTSELLWLKEQF